MQSIIGSCLWCYQATEIKFLSFLYEKMFVTYNSKNNCFKNGMKQKHVLQFV